MYHIQSRLLEASVIVSAGGLFNTTAFEAPIVRFPDGSGKAAFRSDARDDEMCDGSRLELMQNGCIPERAFAWFIDDNLSRQRLQLFDNIMSVFSTGK